MLALKLGELSSVPGSSAMGVLTPGQTTVSRGISKSYDFRDLPCPPQSVMVMNCVYPVLDNKMSQWGHWLGVAMVEASPW